MENAISESIANAREEDTLYRKYLTFALGAEEYGIEIRNVTEIVEVTPITLVPEMPVYVRGIINLRGKIIPVIDLRLLFFMEPKEYDDRTCFVVVEMKDLMVALVVDYVCEVTAIEDISPIPNMNSSAGHEYVKGIGKMPDGVKLLLDSGKLLGIEEFEELAALV